MREVLFRGKRVKDGKWVDGSLFSSMTGQKFIRWEVEDDGAIEEIVQYEVVPETIGQFTGLVDRNGKRVFEGDIVLVNGTKRVGKYVTSIVFKDGCYMLEENKTYLIDSKCLLAVISVVGTIHDNKDLLTGPKSKALQEAAIYGLSVAKTRFENKE